MNDQIAQRAILNALSQHSAYSYRASTQAVNEVLSRFYGLSNKMVLELRELLENLSEAEKIALASGQYTTDQLKEIRTLLNDRFKEILVEVPETFHQSAVSMAVYEASYVSQLMTGAAASASGERLYKKAKSAPLAGGQLINEMFGFVLDKARKQVEYAIRDGINQGQTNQEIITRIRGKRTKVGNQYAYVGGVWDATKVEIERTVRTARSHVANVAYDDTWKALGFTHVKFVSTLDGRTSKQCASLDANVYDINKAYPKPPLHYNCLLGDSNVLPVGSISGVSKRWFDGEIIIIKTAGGRVLRCTPNHPILTSKGWIGAGVLNVGGDVICDLVGDWKGISISNHKNTPPLIKDVVDSFLGSSKMLTRPVPVSPEDFHNDGKGSKIAIIGTNRFLRDCFNTPITKHFSKPNFIFRGKGFWSRFSGKSAFKKIFFRPFSAANSIMSSLNDSISFFLRGDRKPSKLLLRPVSSVNSMLGENGLCGSNSESMLGVDSRNTNTTKEDINNLLFRKSSFSNLVKNMLFASGSRLHTIPLEDIANNILGDIQLIGDNSLGESAVKKIDNFLHGFWRGGLLYSDLAAILKKNILDDIGSGSSACGNLANGCSRVVGVDDIVSIDRESFSGHVYNLDTDDGYYIANGIITHNCRSVLVGCDAEGDIAGKRPFVMDERKVKDIPKDERKDLIGQLDANTSFKKFFDQTDEFFQKEWLGPARYKLYKEGNYSIDKFVDPQGAMYTLDELKALDAKTFKKLGL